ncbi:exopolysaccharide biosynthesis polyprenyl glycosylphosphotransferase [Variibacter gotjawalensis]|uniref:exopolysaccharide biosynthesis polyprenyl glycosylphosphotransferase n=1 Tax=Variibacter gotjawalensis TaxID=1333996 RepID=UPI001E1AEB4A|nr:Undecaprenyl-phosphate glucose phosphotransferase [Variibacter gotjawalensis]
MKKGQAQATAADLNLVSTAQRRAVWESLLKRRKVEMTRLMVALGAASCDAIAIAAAGGVTDALYHAWADGAKLQLSINFQFAMIICTFIVIVNALRSEYVIENYLRWAPPIPRISIAWGGAFVLALALGFFSKTTADYSRVFVLTFFLSGWLSLLFGRLMLVGFLSKRSRLGADSMRRVVVIGYPADVDAFARKQMTTDFECRVVGFSYLRKGLDPNDKLNSLTELNEDIALAVSTVRLLRPDDVFILIPWSDADALDRCVTSFTNVPVSLHLRPELVMERFSEMSVARVGGLLGLNVARQPLTFTEVLLKRAFDVVVSAFALVVLSPLFAIVSILIRLDSPGSAIFVQERYGFNQEPFRAFKFRTMRASADRTFRQAQKDDDRITRLGRFLRRWNIDELPQLVNVLRGEMSLVGPRPHALAHDRAFEQRIAHYARRHNVKPGITGWAQVNGFRGITATDAAMQGRYEHDLYYINNWSPTLDFKILLLTVFSRKAYLNAN